MNGIRRASVLVAAALVAATMTPFTSTPTLAQDEGAPCSWGSDNVCAIVTTCVAEITVFLIPIINFPVKRCVAWEEETSYWKPVPNPPEESSTDTQPSEPESPPGGDAA